MPREKSDKEKELLAKASAFKESCEISSWNQEAHCAFLCKLALDAGLPKEKAESFLADLLRLGLGGNASQFAQAAGFRSPKAEDSASAAAKYKLI